MTVLFIQNYFFPRQLLHATDTPRINYALMFLGECNTMRIAEVATKITLRLDPELERSVQTTAKNLGLTKSELIRKSIHEYLGNLGRSSPWELGEDIFGKYSSGRGDISMNRKDLVRDKIKAKRK